MTTECNVKKSAILIATDHGLSHEDAWTLAEFNMRYVAAMQKKMRSTTDNARAAQALVEAK